MHPANALINATSSSSSLIPPSIRVAFAKLNRASRAAVEILTLCLHLFITFVTDPSIMEIAGG